MKFQAICFSTKPHLNDLLRDLNLSKKQSEFLGLRIKNWNLQKDIKVSFYCSRHCDFEVFFHLGIVWCFATMNILLCIMKKL